MNSWYKFKKMEKMAKKFKKLEIDKLRILNSYE